MNGVSYRRKRRILEELKSGPCVDCGGTFRPECMDWTHKPGTEKLFQISQGHKYTWPEVEAEIAKCELVCANCHRIRTRNRLVELGKEFVGLRPFLSCNQASNEWTIFKDGRSGKRALNDPRRGYKKEDNAGNPSQTTD